MSRTSVGVTSALLAILVSAVSAAPVQHRGVFIYSTLCSGEEDDAGQQFVIMRLPDESLSVQREGEPPLTLPRVLRQTEKIPHCGRG